MPRPKVDAASRRRVAHACRYCKASKQKCDGQTPCSQCVKRRRPDACKRSPGLSSQNEPSPLGTTERTSSPSASAAVSKDGEAASAPHPEGLRIEPTVPELLVPQRSATMYDTKGKAGMHRNLSKASSSYSCPLTLWKIKST